MHTGIAGHIGAQIIEVIAPRHLCFVACLHVAARDGFGVDIDQAAIANHLGVVLPVGSDPSELVDFGIHNFRFEDEARFWGINPLVSEINKALRQLRIECRFESILKFQDWEFEKRLIDLTGSGQFPIVCFEYSALFRAEMPKDRAEMPKDQGHCVIVRQLQKLNGHTRVEIDDPGPDDAGIKSVDCESLYLACPRWTSENRPYVDTSKPANGAEPEQEYLYPGDGH